MITILLTALVGYLALCYVLANNYLHPQRFVPELPSGLSEVSVPTRFGATPSWATPGIMKDKPSEVIFLLAHGYGGTRGSWNGPMHDLYGQGFDSLALSMPGQDASPVNAVSFGVKDAHVIVDGVNWLRTRFPGHKVVVLGVSMGGAAAWMATKEDPKIDGIVTDAAFAQFDESMNAFFDRKVRGGRLWFAPVVWIAEWMSGISAATVRPVDSAVLWRGKPALVIQGDSDTLVVPNHAQRLSAAADCPLWMVPGAEHAECYEIDRIHYLSHLTNFAAQIEARSKTVHSVVK